MKRSEKLERWSYATIAFGAICGYAGIILDALLKAETWTLIGCLIFLLCFLAWFGLSFESRIDEFDNK